MKKTKPNRSGVSEDTRSKPEAEESVDLSAEAISNRSSAKTEVLNEMLERERKAYNLRYWGINE
jgi:hypothetical protein